VLIHRILFRHRRQKPKARTGRSASRPCFQLESLEDRTALSAAWPLPQLAPAVNPTVAMELIAVRTQTLELLESSAPTSIVTGAANSAISASIRPDVGVIVSSMESTAATFLNPTAVEGLPNAPLATGGGTSVATLQVPDASNVPRSSPLPGTLESAGAITDPRVIESLDMTASKAMFDASNIMWADARFMTPGFLMSLFPIPEDLNGFDLPRGVFAANPDDKDIDQSLSGTLEWMETDIGFLTWMSLTQTSGRSSGLGSSTIFAELAVQVSSSHELASPSGLSFLATAGSASVLAELSAPRADNVILIDQAEIDSETTVPILDAGIPLSILRSDTDVPIPTEQGGVEQVTELIPLSQSSLALAATLWTVRSDSQPSAGGSDLPAGAATDPTDSFSTPTQWAVFMTGVDRAFQQTFRDVQVDAFAGDGRHKKSEETQRGMDDPLQWQGPILPGAAEGLGAGTQRSSRSRKSSAGDESKHADDKTPWVPGRSDLRGGEREETTSQALESAQAQDGDVQPVVLASTPVLWVVSVSSIVAGWFWGKKRERRQCMGLGESHCTSH
jgi:hypothetical protein